MAGPERGGVGLGLEGVDVADVVGPGGGRLGPVADHDPDVGGRRHGAAELVVHVGADRQGRHGCGLRRWSDQHERRDDDGGGDGGGDEQLTR